MKANRTVVGVDTAKRVFQLHWVELETGELVDLRLTRAKFLEHFANRARCLVGMEACGGAQHWARSLRELGHEVRLLRSADRALAGRDHTGCPCAAAIAIGPLQHRPDSLAHGPRGLRLQVPDRREDLQHVRAC